MSLNDHQVVELEELFSEYDSYYCKECIAGDNGVEYYTFKSKQYSKEFFKFKSLSNNQVEIVRNDTRMITLSYESAIQSLKHWFVKFQPERSESFTDYHMSRFRLVGEENEDYCRLQIITKHRIRFISYFNPDHFFELVPVEENGVKIKRELLFTDGSHQTSERGFENCFGVLQSWIAGIKKTVTSSESNVRKRDENKEILETIFKAEGMDSSTEKIVKDSLKELILKTLRWINNQGYINVKESLWKEQGLKDALQIKIKEQLLSLKSVRIKEGEPFTFEITDPVGVTLLKSPYRLRNDGRIRIFFRFLAWIKKYIGRIITGIIIGVIVAIILLYIKPLITMSAETNEEAKPSSKEEYIRRLSGKVIDKSGVGVKGVQLNIVINGDTIASTAPSNRSGVFGFDFSHKKVQENSIALLLYEGNGIISDHEEIVIASQSPLLEITVTRIFRNKKKTNGDNLDRVIAELTRLEDLYKNADQSNTKELRVKAKEAARDRISLYIEKHKIPLQEVIDLCTDENQGILSGLAYSIVRNPKKEDIQFLYNSFTRTKHNFTIYTYGLALKEIYEAGLIEESDCEFVGSIIHWQIDKSYDNDTKELLIGVRDLYKGTCVFFW